MNELVSVIIPSYNCAGYIAETLDSLCAQSYNYWEAIVVDDGSTDDTKDIVRAIADVDCRVRYVFQSNSGVSAARNFGISLAGGRFVVFLDADDLITPSVLFAHVENFTKNPALGISCIDFQYFANGFPDQRYSDYSLCRLGRGGNKYFGSGEVTFPRFIEKNWLPLQSAMFDAGLIDRVGFFDESMRALEDWDYVLRSIVSGAVILFAGEATALALVRVRAGSATKTIRFSDYLDKVYENIRAYIVSSLASADIVRCRFYLFRLDVQKAELARRKKIKSEGALILHMVYLIKGSGLAGWKVWFDLCRLYGVSLAVRAFLKYVRFIGKGAV